MQNVDCPLPSVEELQAQIAELLTRIAQLETDNIILEREKVLALDVVQQQQMQVSSLTHKQEYTQLELSRARRDQEELQDLRRRDRMIDEICATPHEQLGPSEKLVMIQAHKQIPYSAARHGGQAEVKLTSLSQWALSVGGSEKIIRRALDNLKTGGTMVDEQVNTGDGKRHYSVMLNETHFFNPRKFIRVEKAEERKHNGGEKRCPNCKEVLTKNLQISYECTHCGIDYDRDLNPVNHKLPAPLPAPEQEPSPNKVLQFVPRELPIPDDTPLPDLLTEEDFNAFGSKKARS